jgi:hypothetical protein
MDPAIDHPGAPRAGDPPNLVAAQRVAGVHADADHVARLDGFRVELLDRFVDQDRVAGRGRRGGGQHKEPARGDDGGAKSVVAGVDQVHTHRTRAFVVRESPREENPGVVHLAEGFAQNAERLAERKHHDHTDRCGMEHKYPLQPDQHD